MPANDSDFKAIIWHRTFRQYQPQEFMSKFLHGAVYVGMLPTELSREPLRADALLRVRYPADEGKEYALHLEVQSYYDSMMAHRLCTYAVLAYERDKLGVVPVVIYLEPCSTPQSPCQIAGPFGPTLTFQFHVVRLWEESLDDWLAAGFSGPLLKGASIGRMDEMADAVGRIPDQAQRENSLHYLVHFADRAFGSLAVVDYLRGNPMLDQIIQESGFYKEIVQRGLREGMQEGIKEGELNGRRSDILAIVTSRFPQLEQATQDRLNGIADAAAMRDMLIQVANATDEAAVRAALGLPQP